MSNVAKRIIEVTELALDTLEERLNTRREQPNGEEIALINKLINTWGVWGMDLERMAAEDEVSEQRNSPSKEPTHYILNSSDIKIPLSEVVSIIEDVTYRLNNVTVRS